MYKEVAHVQLYHQRTVTNSMAVMHTRMAVKIGITIALAALAPIIRAGWMTNWWRTAVVSAQRTIE